MFLSGGGVRGTRPAVVAGPVARALLADERKQQEQRRAAEERTSSWRKSLTCFLLGNVPATH